MPEDDPFVRRLVIETLTEQLCAWTWPEPIRTQLLDLQYASRRQRTSPAAPAAESILMLDGQDAGWMIVAELADEIRLVEIMVLAEHRGRGLASAAIRELLATAARAGKSVRLQVNLVNHRAIALYERLGFRLVERDEVQQLMERLPS